MFKTLDRLVLKAFLGPFVGTFFVITFVLVMQFFWLYIDDFVGKGLNIDVILRFVGFQSAALIPTALPLAVLLSSLMTFGNLGESYELVAVKSAGISLLRFMRPLFIFVFFLSLAALAFANYTIPVANLKSRTLLQNIVYSRPSFDLKEGVFYDKITGFSIKVGKKEKNDSVIRDIIIYEQSSGVQDNFIVASHGVMRTSDDKSYLEFHLRDGWRYEERTDNRTMATDFIRLGFKEYKKSFNLSSFGFQQTTADSMNRQNAQMYSMRQLEEALDSLKGLRDTTANRVQTEVYTMLNTPRLPKTSTHAARSLPAKKGFDQLIPDSLKTFVQQAVSNRIGTMKVANDALVQQLDDQERAIRHHKVEWHRKLSLSFACLVLFLIGAPLGAIIRKGGIGSPMVFAIIFFIIFFFTSSTGEKFAKEGKWSVAAGMWVANLSLIPVGVFLTYKAMNDSQLFNKEFYTRLWRRLRVKRAAKPAGA